jgi:4a-hydroxytetrahydrobiopterin dehydratase
MNERVLSDADIETQVAKLDVAWAHIPGQGLIRVFETHDFAEGLALVNKIGQIAEQLGHHPEVVLRYSEVEVTNFTHDAGGVTAKDMELAEAIDGFEL